MLVSQIQSLLSRVENMMNPRFLHAKDTEQQNTPSLNDDVLGIITQKVGATDTMKRVDKRAYKQTSEMELENLLTELKNPDTQIYTGFFCVRMERPLYAATLFDEVNTERYNLTFDLGPPLTIDIEKHMPEEEDFYGSEYREISDISSVKQFCAMIYTLHYDIGSYISIPSSKVNYKTYTQPENSLYDRAKTANRKYLLKWMNKHFGDNAASHTASRDQYIQHMFEIESKVKLTYTRNKAWTFRFHSEQHETRDRLTVENDKQHECFTVTTRSKQSSAPSPRTYTMKFTDIHSVGKLVHLLRTRMYWNADYEVLTPYPGGSEIH